MLTQQRGPWKQRSAKALARCLYDVGRVAKEDLPRRPADADARLLGTLQKRFHEALEAPLERYARHLQPSLQRRIHVGTMHYMEEAHEEYRRAFDYLETTNTWHDTDTPWRQIPHFLRMTPGLGFQEPAEYEKLAARARDGFSMVIKVSHVATHNMKLEKPEEWWPMLYKEKYSKLGSAVVAYLWQFGPRFECDRENFTRLEDLVGYMASSASGCPEARHIVEFRHSSWYSAGVYEFLNKWRWCLSWQHINNTEDPETGRKWAGDLPSGWTDRVQTTDFCYIRLFGPDGPSHGSYNKKFLHELFDGCPYAATSYVNFGNRELVGEKDPQPRPAYRNAVDFRTIFTKMDFVERVRSVRYKGDCPRELTRDECLLVNSFYLRYSKVARERGVKMATRAGTELAKKYYPMAPAEKRSFEWLPANARRKLHLSLHDAKEDEDLWTHLRQLTGFEDLEAAKEWAREAPKLAFYGEEEVVLFTSSFIRFSQAARDAGLLRTTQLEKVTEDGTAKWTLSNGKALELTLDSLAPEEDLWPVLVDLSRVSPEELGKRGKVEKLEHPFKSGKWKEVVGSMWTQEFGEPGEKEEKVAEEGEVAMEEETKAWETKDGENNTWEDKAGEWNKTNSWGAANSWGQKKEEKPWEKAW